MGFLLTALGLLAVTGILTALDVVRHPWTAGTRQMLAAQYKHPLLAHLAPVVAAVLALGWLSIPTLLQVPIPLWLTLGGMALAVVVPLLAIDLFDLRR